MRIRPQSPDHQVAQAIAVHVPGSRYGEAACIAERHSAECEAMGSIQSGQVHVRREPGSLAEYDVAGSGAVIGLVAMGSIGADDEIVIAVVGRRDRSAATIAGRLSAQLEPVGPVQARQANVRREARGLAENHVAGPGLVAVRSRELCANDDVAEPIAVDVSCGSDRDAGEVSCSRSGELEAVGPFKRRHVDIRWILRQCPPPVLSVALVLSKHAIHGCGFSSTPFLRVRPPLRRRLDRHLRTPSRSRFS